MIDTHAAQKTDFILTDFWVRYFMFPTSPIVHIKPKLEQQTYCRLNTAVEYGCPPVYRIARRRLCRECRDAALAAGQGEDTAPIGVK